MWPRFCTFLFSFSSIVKCNFDTVIDMSYGTSFVSSYHPGIESNLEWNIVILIIIIIITTIIIYALASCKTKVWSPNLPPNSSSSVASIREYQNCSQWLSNICRLIAACPSVFYFAWLTLTFWIWRRFIPAKSPAFSKQHGLNIQENVPFIFTVVRTSNSTVEHNVKIWWGVRNM